VSVFIVLQNPWKTGFSELESAAKVLEQIMAHSKKFVPITEFCTQAYFVLQRMPA
jgi:hypothetical protein